MLSKAYIPYKGYFSSPFSRWQGTLAAENAIVLGAATARRWMSEKKVDPQQFDYVYLGFTVAQRHGFYGAPWAAAMMGMDGVPGLNISQACSTSTTCLWNSALGLENDQYDAVFNLMADRCSNGPHLVWPNPNGPGGQVEAENWMMDNFGFDPWAKNAMIQTAENVAKEAGIGRAECDAITVRRYEQYLDALADDRAFQKRYMFPLEVQVSRKKTITLEADEGVTPCTQEGLAGLKTVTPDGVHSFGSQTHPADGNCSIIMATRDKARELSADPSLDIQVLSYGYARAKKGFMAAAVAPACKKALDRAGVTVKDVKAIKTHNPFAVNDIFLARELGIDWKNFNNYGSSLIFGHPQGPTAGRCVIELIEELAMAGGGYGMFGGCAAGDTAASLVLKVG